VGLPLGHKELEVRAVWPGPASVRAKGYGALWGGGRRAGEVGGGNAFLAQTLTYPNSCVPLSFQRAPILIGQRGSVQYAADTRAGG
jgi:hypothetical protein